jgi:hypothetical protein
MAQRVPGGRCAYVILAHRDPGQLERLLAALAPAAIFVHVDSAVPSPRFRDLAGVSRGRAALLPRFRTAWASWALVEATLTGYRAALETPASHVTLLSGQDYPLRPRQEIDRYVEPGRSYMGAVRLPFPSLGPDGGMNRVRFWHTRVRGRKCRLPVSRRYPEGFEPWFAGQWAILARSAVESVFDTSDRRPDLARFYRHVWIPDEGFVGTAVMNSVPRDAVSTDSLWFARWGGGRHPAVLDDDDWPELASAARGPSQVGGPAEVKLFARKFETGVSDGLLARIDQTLLR